MQLSENRICFIINPAADRNRSAQNINWIRKEASERWKSYEIVIIDEHERLDDVARSRARYFDIIVACGGDGTISQVVNGIANTDCILGVLPIGSGNDFAKSLKLKRSLPECMEILRTCRVTEIDLIRYRGDVSGWCANTIGLGLDGWANYYSHQINRVKGKAIYFLGALRAILSFRGAKMKLELQDKKMAKNLLMVTVCNGKWEGGSFLVAPEADMKDGIMNVLLIEKIPTYLLVAYLLRFKWGPKETMRGVHQINSKGVNIKSEKPLAVHRDGEQLGTGIRQLQLTVKEKVLNVIIP